MDYELFEKICIIYKEQSYYSYKRQSSIDNMVQRTYPQEYFNSLQKNDNIQNHDVSVTSPAPVQNPNVIYVQYDTYIKWMVYIFAMIMLAYLAKKLFEDD